MKQLQLKFHTSEGKSKTLSVNYVDQELTGDQVKSTMEKIAATKIFIKGGVHLYDVPVSAKYVERTETPLFGDDAGTETPAPTPEVPAGR
ncbi:DUF2922 domain-containing protein [Schleiferilactobacillus perolens]|jgi:hypothetical protein|uniref:DUF2922 domain-containing protein n=1 Tax=Schleiferilactobacillus perolens DSM 12744 TaxID=1423792 RepID=A0A0R1NCP2_9LACO|nr:DUF2922 domain-containing protein [Schleiferilactobacillus perolens]KRL14571.1 hypothetical protein FD09_GL000223 [Schleiferilactobacillus perolens DSM 12744]MCI2170089.1 DUF2922 domain-containing protein [Schleiferilactobacillus perolens]